MHGSSENFFSYAKIGKAIESERPHPDAGGYIRTI